MQIVLTWFGKGDNFLSLDVEIVVLVETLSGLELGLVTLHPRHKAPGTVPAAHLLQDVGRKDLPGAGHVGRLLEPHLAEDIPLDRREAPAPHLLPVPAPPAPGEPAEPGAGTGAVLVRRTPVDVVRPVGVLRPVAVHLRGDEGQKGHQHQPEGVALLVSPTHVLGCLVFRAFSREGWVGF